MWGGDSRRRGSVEIKVRNLDEEHAARGGGGGGGGGPTASSLSMGWLLRLFRSDFFDAWMAVTYLYRYRDSRGVHDYLCNELYHLADVDLEVYLPQVCNLLVYHAKDSPALERFVMDKCANSMHFALQVFWFLQAAVEDAVRENNKKAEARSRLLRTRCETAAVNGSRHGAMSTMRAEARLVNAEPPLSPRPTTRRPRPAPAPSKPDIPPKPAGPSIVHNGMGEQAAKGSSTRLPPASQSAAQETQRGRSSSREKGDSNRLGHVRSLSEPPAMWEDIIKNPDALVGGDEGATSREVAQPDVKHDGSSAVNAEGDALEPQNDGASQESSSLQAEMAQLESPPVQTAAVDEDASQATKRTPEVEKLSRFAFCDQSILLTMKQERFDYFNDTLTVINAFVNLSRNLREVAHEKRSERLKKGLAEINDILLRRMAGEPLDTLPGRTATSPHCAEKILEMGERAALRSVHLPLSRAMSPALRVLRIGADEAVILTSRTRVPYMLFIEVLPTSMACSDPLLYCHDIVHDMEQKGTPVMRSDAREATPPPSPSSSRLRYSTDIADTIPSVATTGSEKTPLERLRDNVRMAVYGKTKTSPFSKKKLEREEIIDDVTKKARQAALLAVYGELWSWKQERIVSSSPFRKLPGVKLMPFIVKAGDDLRQEQLAIQLISQFQWIFATEDVDVYLRPFTVMCVSSDAGLVEFIPDAVSIHSLKKRTPNFTSLLDYFIRCYGPTDSKSFKTAQREFIRSMAGYSLVTYFLQIKDRHNGNIMVDAEGHVIHIDFGFMLANSPGAIKFESYPFKLTEEYVQVICGMENVAFNCVKANQSEGWQYYRELVVLGFLAARKHYEKLTTLVEIMMEGTSMPCMTGGHAVVEGLRNRFNLGVPEGICISHVLGLIEESRNSWRSAGYDKFQFYTNGYL